MASRWWSMVGRAEARLDFVVADCGQSGAIGRGSASVIGIARTSAVTALSSSMTRWLLCAATAGARIRGEQQLTSKGNGERHRSTRERQRTAVIVVGRLSRSTEEVAQGDGVGQQ
ncbi:hypothetical protein NL676_005186 [Syzygium grande]|nr:hypothetical protein NL676_005186 [Syzygium grande]